MAEMTVGELVTNIMWAKIDGGLDQIKCSLNWMWPAGTVEEKSRMYETVRHITSVLRRLLIAMDGGKDSVSMVADGVKSPGSVVISGYAPMTNV
jgi:phosphoribosylformylglycinamidine synthase